MANNCGFALQRTFLFWCQASLIMCGLSYRWQPWWTVQVVEIPTTLVCAKLTWLGTRHVSEGFSYFRMLWPERGSLWSCTSGLATVLLWTTRVTWWFRRPWLSLQSSRELQVSLRKQDQAPDHAFCLCIWWGVQTALHVQVNATRASRSHGIRNSQRQLHEISTFMHTALCKREDVLHTYWKATR